MEGVKGDGRSLRGDGGGVEGERELEEGDNGGGGVMRARGGGW